MYTSTVLMLEESEKTNPKKRKIAAQLLRDIIAAKKEGQGLGMYSYSRDVLFLLATTSLLPKLERKSSQRLGGLTGLTCLERKRCACGC